MNQRSRRERAAGVWAALALTLACAAPAVHGQQSEQQVEQRVTGLLARMTAAEKIGQLSQYFFIIPGPVKPEEHARRGEAGSFLFVTDPAVANRLQHIAVEESRMHIPILFGFD